MRSAVTLVAILSAIPALAEAYDVFDPTPSSALRPFSPDRPDTTEGPYTVDAGHFQAEWELVSLSRDRTDDVKNETVTSSVDLKLGLTDNVDLQLILEPHTYTQTTIDGERHTARGMNDTELRAKVNLWGNDGGDTAFALLPFLRLPTHSDAFGRNGKTEGGLILPLGFKVPGDWDAGAMLEAEAVRDDANERYVMQWVESVSFSHSIQGNLSGFLEMLNRHERGVGNEVYFDAGLKYSLGSNMQIDGGFNAGLTEQAEDWRFFLGFSWRD